MIQLTEQGLIAMKQHDWEALNRQAQILTQAIKNLKTYSEQLYDGKEYTDVLNNIDQLEDDLAQVNGEQYALEDWLIDHRAPGWVTP